MRISFVWSFFVFLCALNAFAAVPYGFKTPLPRCVGSLRSSHFSNDEIAPLTDNFLKPLEGLKGAERKAVHLQLLKDFVGNPKLLTAASENDWRVTPILRELSNVYADAEFADKILPLFRGLMGHEAATAVENVYWSVPPEGLREASDFESDFFSESLSSASHAKVARFFGDYPELESRYVTRRILAFMTRNPQLSSTQKINFARNLFLSFKSFQNSRNVEPGDIFYFKEYDSKRGDGAKIFCGHDCVYYFVIEKDGTFRSLMSKHGNRVDSTAEVQNDWRATASSFE